MVILRSLGKVFREGDFSQEIVLVILLLAMLSIGGGVVGHFIMPGFDFSQDGMISPTDDSLFVQIWFAFRTLMAAGNLSSDPLGNDYLALFSVIGVVLGMFILAFFIGIGSSIISGLMAKLRNEKLMMANHLVIIGWNRAAPFIIEKLKLLSERNFTRLKLVFLGETAERPPELASWVTFRWGDTEDVESMQRINLGSARQVLVCAGDSLSPAEELSQNMFSLMAIRQMNPEIPVSYTVMGMVQPRLKSYRHMLQIGWDKVNYYDKPTVLISEPDMRANLIRNVLVYQDVDQVLSRLMIPEREDESAMLVVEWSGKIVCRAGEWCFSDGTHMLEVREMMQRCFARGVILVAIAGTDLRVHPLISLSGEVEVFAILGVAMDSPTLFGEFEFSLRQKVPARHVSEVRSLVCPKLVQQHVRLLVIGWVGALPLVLKRLLDSYQSVDLTLLDDMDREEHADITDYVLRRIGEMDGAHERMKIDIRRWDFSDMEALREHVRGTDKLIVSRPAHVVEKPHAMVASVLSHTFTLAEEESCRPEMFAIVDTRNQARMLQKELERFPLEMDVNVVVPMEFYGTYAAHTSYLMHASTSSSVYGMHRSLRYLLDSLMSNDAGTGVPLSLEVVPFPQGGEMVEAGDMFASLLDQGSIWLGYRIDSAVADETLKPGLLMRLFPRRYEFQCLRQLEIMINPLGNPQSARCSSLNSCVR